MKDWEHYNEEEQKKYASTGHRLLLHPDAVADLRAGKNHPVTLHIMPTERCNLNCVFCSVAERDVCPDLLMDQILFVVGVLKERGLKAVIFSGGGEPLLYPRITELLDYLSNSFDVGLITNGTMLKRVKTSLLNRLTWIRVSTNSYDYGIELEIPKITSETTLGFSYLWNERTTYNIIDRVTELALSNNVKYIRLVPDCTMPTEQLEEEHVKMHKIAQKLGPPWFHQYKIHRQPAECHLGRTHPVLYADGLIYPCDSLVLNAPQDNRRFDSKYSLCRWDEVETFFDAPINGTLLNTDICPHCIFTRQNEIITEILAGDVPEAPTDVLEHVNFV